MDGEVRGTSGEVRGTFEEVWETSGDLWIAGRASHGVSRALRARNAKESEKSPERAPQGRTPVPKECAPESQNQVLDSFRTLLRLHGALFRDFWGPAPGYSFRTAFGIFLRFGPAGPGDPVWGGRPDRNLKIHSERSSGKVVGDLPGKPGDFPEAQGSLTLSQRLTKLVSNSGSQEKLARNISRESLNGGSQMGA